jgi:hypothetical protein
MECALCQDQPANKENTHYLTDGIIRSCLNQDGSNTREKGFYFDLSTTSSSAEFNFQRNTSVAKLRQALGREPSEEEISRALDVPFSVDNVFCSQCEAIFTTIENQFINSILPKLRGVDLEGLPSISFHEPRILYLFVYLQVWRTAICEDIFTLSREVQEELRQIILNQGDLADNQLTLFPVILTYLHTSGGPEEFTKNAVGCAGGNNPNIVLMNDFVIQFFDSEDCVRFEGLYGLNDSEGFRDTVNASLDQFHVPIVANEVRKTFITRYSHAGKVQQMHQYIAVSFAEEWIRQGQLEIDPRTYKRFLDNFLGGDEFNILQYTEEHIRTSIKDFVDTEVPRQK